LKEVDRRVSEQRVSERFDEPSPSSSGSWCRVMSWRRREGRERRKTVAGKR